ncbi:MAG: exodeoxyribonuclease VII small subunit [Sporolactobacillus sp.]
MSEDHLNEQLNTLTFEDAMDKLEMIVRQLEENDVPLEKSIELFQTGMDLSKLCHDKLENVGEKMDRLIKENGEVEPFSVSGEERPQ